MATPPPGPGVSRLLGRVSDQRRGRRDGSGDPEQETPGELERSAWQVWIPGHWPSYTDIHESGNHYTTRRIKLKWQDDVALLVKAAKVPACGSVWLRYTHYRRERRGDKSNLASAAMKIVEDALVTSRVIRDDCWRFVVGFSHDFVIDPVEGLKVIIIDMGKPV